jgi:hypothetical protein
MHFILTGPRYLSRTGRRTGTPRNRSDGKIDFIFTMYSIGYRHSPPKPTDTGATLESGGLAHRDSFDGILAGQQALHVRWN